MHTKNRTTRVSGWLSNDSRCSWPGGEIHPNGNARPNRNTRIGITSAATTPPALNSIHTNGSIDRLAMKVSGKILKIPDSQRRNSQNVILGSWELRDWEFCSEAPPQTAE